MPPPAMSVGQQPQQHERRSVADAVDYLDKVKLRKGPLVYNVFSDVMKDFQSRTIDTPTVISRVKNLFKGHQDLILGFNTFLPPGQKIEVPRETVNGHQPDQQMPPPTMLQMPPPAMSVGQQPQQHERRSVADAVGYLDKVKLRKGPLVYNVFLDVMKDFQSRTIDTPTVISRVKNLFKGHQDLILGFNTFLPPGQKIEVPCETVNGHQPDQQQNHHSYNQPPRPRSETTPSSRPPLEFSHAISFVDKFKNRFQNQPDVYRQFLAILRTYQNEHRLILNGVNSGLKSVMEIEVYQQVANLLEHHEDLLAEFELFVEDSMISSDFI
ncbi:hypothetical protein BsWGS_23734 [Bradybaena similaris]